VIILTAAKGIVIGCVVFVGIIVVSVIGLMSVAKVKAARSKKLRENLQSLQRSGTLANVHL
jgi:hypothetical protein